ncbi:MAG: hypothetical protein ACRDL7_08070, partial [Gaiellaceae bacterium]
MWLTLFEKAEIAGNPNPLASKRKGAISLMQKLDQSHPNYLHELYRRAIDVLGTQATFQEIAEQMSLHSKVPGETRPQVDISKGQVRRWFKRHRGKEKRLAPKPLLTEELKGKRLFWAQEILQMLERRDFYYAFLDEKWFYTTSRRKKMKSLPQGPFEATGAERVYLPRMRSRRHAIKVMFLGVVAPPDPDHDFSGKILLERISKKKKIQRKSHHQRFVDDGLINSELKAQTDGWRIYTSEEMTMRDIADTLAEQYLLDEFVHERLVFSYRSQANGKDATIYLNDVETIQDRQIVSEQQQPGRALTMNDIQLHVEMQSGDIVDEDVSCDSTYMLSIMATIGQELRTKFHWVNQQIPIYLFLDNTGGHGTH